MELKFNTTDLLAHHMRNHFLDDMKNEHSIDYFDKWLPLFIDFQTLIFKENSKLREKPVTVIHRKVVVDRVVDGCPICEHLMNLFNYRPNLPSKGFYNSNLKSHILSHLQCKSFCLLCDCSFTQIASMLSHMSSAHEPNCDQFISWNSLPTLEEYVFIKTKVIMFTNSIIQISFYQRSNSNHIILSRQI